MPLVGLQSKRKGGTFPGNTFLVQIGQRVVLFGIPYSQVHLTGFLVGDFYVVGTDRDFKEMPSPNRLQIHVREIEGQGIFLVFEHKPKSKRAVLKIESMPDGGRMIRFRVGVDIHVPISQIDFFMAFGGFIAARGPLVAGFVFKFLRFCAFEAVLEDQGSEVLFGGV